MCSYLLDELSRTIGARLLIMFHYDGHTYVLEPHLLGRNQQMQDCLLAWVTSCHSLPSSENAWNTFLLNKIEQLKATDDRFTKHRPGYDPYDNSMSRIYYRL
ncbi:hypothetical protein ACFSRY_02955 [Pontibacter locisalis]|uniref:Uncharacterized protein n=1 Tax=Pontibacter locisalis TaxID=1719035 RepID=A0ABW5IIL0_9BACT